MDPLFERLRKGGRPRLHMSINTLVTLGTHDAISVEKAASASQTLVYQQHQRKVSMPVSLCKRAKVRDEKQDCGSEKLA